MRTEKMCVRAQIYGGGENVTATYLHNLTLIQFIDTHTHTLGSYAARCGGSWNCGIGGGGSTNPWGRPKSAG